MGTVKPDVKVSNHGSLCLISALSDAAKDWVNEHVVIESWQMWDSGLSFVCEPRYIDDLVFGMREEGLVVA